MLQNLFCKGTQMYKHPVYTRPANRWSHLQRVARRILYFRTALQGITVYIVALVIESKRASLSSSSEPRYLRGKDCDTWKARDIPRLRRWEPGQDRRMADPWHRSFIVEARESRPRGPIAQQRDNRGKETRRFSPRFFRNDFFARDRPSNPVTSFQVRNRVKASVINAPWLFLFFFFFCLFAFYIYIYIFRIVYLK